jgi:hypothetical protein
MQQRRFRPGDVLDDYCPRERRITDHAVVAMIEDHIKQTRCVVCDAEHEYKDGKVPPQRRKKPQTALFAQVLDGLQGPQPAARPAPQDAEDDPDDDFVDEADVDTVAGPEVIAASIAAVAAMPVVPVVPAAPPQVAALHADASKPDDENSPRDEGSVRRQLIRAALPRPEGHVPQPTRVMPDFTVRQPTNNRGPRHGRRRGGAGGGHQGQSAPGPMRFGRGNGSGQGNARGSGNGNGQGQGGQRPNGARNHGRRGGKPR